jgi:RNA polymerase sigma-70 factor (ECF subfamily)
MKALTDEKLLLEYRQGRADRFELLVRRYAQELYHCVYRLLGSAAAAEDVVQETFLQVHLAAARFDPRRRFRPWVFTIAVNKARDSLRSRRRPRESSLDNGAAGAAEGPRFADLLADANDRPVLALETEERSLRIRSVVSRLPDHLREVLVLGYYHGMAYKDMADVLGVPLGTVKSRLHAAVAAFGRLHEAEDSGEREPTAVVEDRESRRPPPRPIDEHDPA